MVGKCVKVRFINEEKVRNKVFRIQEMGYRELVTKIGESFQMIEGKKYWLSYVDAEKDVIEVNCEEDFGAFLESMKSLIL